MIERPRWENVYCPFCGAQAVQLQRLGAWRIVNDWRAGSYVCRECEVYFCLTGPRDSEDVKEESLPE